MNGFFLPSETSTHSWALDIFYHPNCNFIYYPLLLALPININPLSWSLILVIPLNCTLLKAIKVSIHIYLMCCSIIRRTITTTRTVSFKKPAARELLYLVPAAGRVPEQSPLSYPHSPFSTTVAAASVTP